MHRHLSNSVVVAGALAAALFAAWPAAAAYDLSDVPIVAFAALDLAGIQAEDQVRADAGEPPRFAIPNAVLLTPSTIGRWEDLDSQTRLWRLRIQCPGVKSINLGFQAYHMPSGGRLDLRAADGSATVGPYTAGDNAVHGELWTAVCLTDDMIVQVTVPRDAESKLILVLTSVNLGYRYFGEVLPPTDSTSYCEIDVVCPSADPWRAEIPAIGAISIDGSMTCTGFMLNNTAQDRTPYFQTAYHCGLRANNAASLVVYWNYQSPTCGAHGGGSTATHQSGSTFRAGYSTSDFTLVQLSQSPNPAWKITYAGWDHSNTNATSAVGIHQPGVQEKSISFSPFPTRLTSWLGDNSPGDGTHVRVEWARLPHNLGVTEPGSSGSPIFDQNHHVLGQLHGGPSACGVPDSSMHDFYGNFAMSWTGGGSNSTRLSNWLDPLNTGAASLNTLGIRGDLNCDGLVNFDDIDPFVLALSDEAGYQAAYPTCNSLNGDCNGDGVVSFDDIDAFVALLTG